MEIPEAITLEVHDTRGIGVPGVIIQLEVKSGTKNSYHILSPKTDADGRCLVTKDDFIGQFEDHWEMGVMDYNGSIEKAEPVVAVELYQPEWALRNKEHCLAWPLLKNEASVWSSRKEKYRYITSCSNYRFATKNTYTLDTKVSSHAAITVIEL